MNNKNNDKIKKKTIGKIFQRERRKLKLDLDSVSKKLNLKKDIIKALEEENWHLINKNLYLTGLILSYGKILMIDQKTLEQEIQELNIQSNTQNKKHQLVNIGEENDLMPDKNLFHMSIIASSFLILVSLIFFNVNMSKEHVVDYPKLYKDLQND